MWNKILKCSKFLLTRIGYCLTSLKPVERDRRLFGGSGSGMFIFAMITAIVVPGVIILFSKIPTADTVGLLTEKIENNSHVWAVLSQYMDPGNLPSTKGFHGRFWALFSAIAGIFCLSGFTVSSLIALINGFTEKWKKGLLRYDVLFKNYVLIIGVNEQTSAIIRRALRRDDVDYVLIQTRQDVENVRMRLALDLDRKEEEKLVFYCAERISREDIEDLHLEKAVEVYILGEDVMFDNEEDHDAFNIECLEHVSKYMENEQVAQKRRNMFGEDTRLTCHVDFEYQSTFTSFRATHIYQRLDKVVEFHPFNLHEIWAKKVLVDNFAVIPTGKKGEMTVQRYFPLDGDGITCDSNKTVHLIIMGMNQMGTAFGMQAALLAHYPNFIRDNNLKTTITFIDDQAIKEGEFLRGRFESLFDLSCYRVIDCKKEKLVYSDNRTSWGRPHGDGKYNYLQGDGNFMDIHWEFIQGNVANDDVKKYISDIAEDKRNITTIAICFNHPQQALATALYLPRAVFNNALQVLTYQQNSFDILNNVANGEKEWKRYKNLYPFGMIDSSYTESIFDDSRAKIVNYLFVKRDNKDVKERLQKFDSSLIPEIEQTWEYLSLVDKQSNMDMVDSIPGKLRSILRPINAEYHGNPNRVKDELENRDYGRVLVEALANSEHMRWLTERLIMGYRPLEEREYAKIVSGERDKEYYKITHRAHLDICSNERLKVVDEKAPLHDINNILNLPLILKCTEWYNFKYTLNKDNNKSGKISLLRSFLLHGTNKSRNLSFRYVEANTSESKDACHHPFWIADAPLTREQWYIVTGQNKPEKKEKNLPKVEISKEDIEDFLLILRKRTGLYFTLPSEKEWREAALRSTEAYLSNKEEWSSIICYDREKKKNGAWSARSHSEKQKNPLKVYDMVGNVWEWTRTEAENHPDTFYFCGGSWRFKRLECCLDRDYWKTYWAPTLREDDLGCRLLWKFDVEPQEAKMLEQELLSHAKGVKISKEKAVSKWLDEHMVDVEDGFFIMGNENEETVKNRSEEYPRKSPWVCKYAEENETPYHYVHISKFKICSVPVTQELWNLVMGTTSRTNPSENIGNNLPQTNVSYRTIVDKFLVELNRLTGKQYRLPTEAEWEYVAKGAHTHPISAMLSKMYQEHKNLKCADALLKSVRGYSLYAGSDNPDEVAWTRENTNSTRPVKQKKPISDAFKVYDMSGNVWEWCYDFYQSDIYNDCIKGKNREKIQKKEDLREGSYLELGFISNPVCLDDEYSAHVFRGGSWLFGSVDSRCTRPNYWIDSDEDADLGFRLAITE